VSYGPTPPAHPFLASSLVKEQKNPFEPFTAIPALPGTTAPLAAGGRFLLNRRPGVNIFFLRRARPFGPVPLPSGKWPSAGEGGFLLAEPPIVKPHFAC